MFLWISHPTPQICRAGCANSQDDRVTQDKYRAARQGAPPLNGSAALEKNHHRLRTRSVALRTRPVLIGASPPYHFRLRPPFTPHLSPLYPLPASRATPLPTTLWHLRNIPSFPPPP